VIKNRLFNIFFIDYNRSGINIALTISVKFGGFFFVRQTKKSKDCSNIHFLRKELIKNGITSDYLENQTMKKWLVAASMMTLLTSCAYSPIYNGKEPYSGSQFMLMDSPRHTMDFFIESMTEDLMVSNVAVSARTPIAITSFVDLQNMDATNWLGNSVSEGFIHQFQRRGFKVVDFKTTGSIQVTQQGDFALSRDWQDLAQEQQIQYVLTGTMLRQEGGVLVNARVVGMQSRVVVATAQGFLPADRIGRDLDTLNSIRTQDGVLIRSDPTIRQPYTVILRP
jgi:TolB-like protein